MTGTQHSPIDFHKALSLTSTGMICLFGGGGKTGLMFTLAGILAHGGKKVLTTTTTKILYPSAVQSQNTLICNSTDGLLKKSEPLLLQSGHICAGRSHDPETDKLSGFSVAQIKQIQIADLFDWIIIEADGARRRPIKASAGHEPVLPDRCTHLILVTGLDAVGSPLTDANVHRAQQFSRNTGLPLGEPITTDVIVKALNFEMAKAARLCRAACKIIFLNKADTAADKKNGKKVATSLSNAPHTDSVAVAALKPKPEIFHLTRSMGNQ